MRVIIIGAGQVGSSIADNLCHDHDVVVIDTDAERVESLTYSLDVLAIEGDGSELSTLREANIEQTDLVIASTDSDETNLVACGTVDSFTDAFAIARVRGTTYLETWEQSGSAFGVDFMVSTDLLTAETVIRVMGLPAAHDVDSFADGQVLMAEFAVPEASPVVGETIAEADRFDELTFAAIIRGDRILIAEGTTTIEAGDEIVVIGSPSSTRAFAGDLAPERNDGDNVVIVGGSKVAIQIGHLLENRGIEPRLIEDDPTRAREIAETLPNTTVLQSDATDRDFLDQEHIGEADIAIAALDSDNENLLASLLATRLGVTRTVAVVETAEYVDLFEAVGVGASVNPRNATAEEIIRFTRGAGTENVAIIEDDRAEVLEVEINRDSILAERAIRESASDLPSGVVIGGITREDEFLTPRGETVPTAGDHVVIFVRADALDAVTARV